MSELRKIRVDIPDGLRFSDLKLARDPDGHVSFDWEPIERLCEHNALDIALFRDSHEDNVSGLVVAWYMAAREAGEPADPVQDDLIAETLAEDVHGGGFSHPPGNA